MLLLPLLAIDLFKRFGDCSVFVWFLVNLSSTEWRCRKEGKGCHLCSHLRENALHPTSHRLYICLSFSLVANFALFAIRFGLSKFCIPVLQLIGWTPLIELKNIAKKDGIAARLVGKIEPYQPLSSVKDRSALR